MSALAAFGGKYATYVLAAYGFSALAFAWMIADTVVRASRARRAAARLEREIGET